MSGTEIWDVDEEEGVCNEVLEGVGITSILDNGCWIWHINMCS
jgi:hypothetical protein